MVVLSTKELSKKQITLLDKKKFALVHADFIKIKTLNFSLDQINENLIFTSKNAVKSILKNKDVNSVTSKKCFCVGEKTKRFLEKNSFNVIDFASDAYSLAEKIIEKYFNQKFTFFSGTIRKDILPKKLIEKGVFFNEIQVYKTVLQPKNIIIETNAILFFSPSAVESYLQKNKINNQTCFCIGKTTAKALEDISETSELNIVIASQPSIESVIEEVIKYNN
ncbi:uroporphyrinogen-III synthase [Flavobacterium jejuense]|uniref:Uroporphyrinogen-III synthase n=1 Tax=Flavobacterium jejuense TaxID=1544455 RepID=A0ABX0IP87_9FLAO|nr:uroporphyrinogen-III synthase [Flavobacterium jejuense]NHN25642.1 uroporphyrinogen-III synthase [Flavobacterium jejuense]